MLNRQKFFASYLQNFNRDYNKALQGFTPDEQVHITNVLLDILKCFKQETPDYDKTQELNEALYKKYRKRLVKYNNIRPGEYFSEESQKHLDLQFDLKVENAGDRENFFTSEEQQNFLKQAENILKNHKRILYLLTEPEENREELQLVTVTKTKGKHKREAKDELTDLTQEQTALFIDYLQRAKIILKGTNLSNKEAGQVFSILTGYSSDTLRQNLSKAELGRIANTRNRTGLYNLLTRLIALVKKDLEGKNPS